MGPTVSDVADYFLDKFKREGCTVTHLKLQKMCYYAQAYYLAEYGEEMFSSTFEAWKHGPVSRALYSRFRKARHRPLPFPSSVNMNVFTSCMLGVMDVVWNKFWDKDPNWLKKQTHMEIPWRQARGTTPYGESCSEIIDTNVMQDYYKGLIGMKERKPLKPLFKLSQIKQAAKRIDLSSRGTDEEYFDEIQAELEEFRVLRERAAGAWERENE
ncbi:Panacea domain-containing protein [Paenibacillus popilliae]|uniref:Uncharacterized phage-associated protein n=1 Tax=Paenibacillus popilliae ATCC 14706 TaxID=1212764 RepID=M9LQ55_PAEPP|nr:type II toxin-antitoxin system antitoxin SocA domain-containing protein [Paenibacillus popilliae]GAC42831.1 uncharacterized phage-associated protein [Paenibacillus popilliae ATCC 14706]